MNDNYSWTQFRPTALQRASLRDLIAYGKKLSRASKNRSQDEVIARLCSRFVNSVQCNRRADKQYLIASGLLLRDLAMQGWQIRMRHSCLEVYPPTSDGTDHTIEKQRIRRQELLKRDAQLLSPSVRDFVRGMEKTRLFNGTNVSIFCLMRDGRELSEALRKARQDCSNKETMVLSIIDPYIKIVMTDETCPFTGLKLMDIWRYFRHTWTNQYTSIPGRSLMFLVRDRAVPFHPIIGIGALSSPVMQIRERDMWIGWHPRAFLNELQLNPTEKMARWLVQTVNNAISEIYIKDFIEEELVTSCDIANPDNKVIRRLLIDAVKKRRRHHRYARSRDFKRSRPNRVNELYWAMQARSHLFRSKRALALAWSLSARKALKAAFGSRPTAQKLLAFISTENGASTVCKILKKAKGDRIGICVADLTVCGAVQPYNALLGGKLVSMLSVSPEMVSEYMRRYSKTPSEIASSVAGRPIVRSPKLVFLGTTSLYGVGSSQYNRISIPCDRFSPSSSEVIRYQELGRSESFGTSQYSEETVEALTFAVQQTKDGQRVNSIFGEGVSPKLRKVRHGLNVLGLPAGVFLRHHRKRVVYGVSFIRNLRNFLLGIESKPDYLISPDLGEKGSAEIVSWWRSRWLLNRINSDDVLETVSKHTLIRPIRHGARVTPPESGDAS